MRKKTIKICIKSWWLHFKWTSWKWLQVSPTNWVSFRAICPKTKEYLAFNLQSHVKVHLYTFCDPDSKDSYLDLMLIKMHLPVRIMYCNQVRCCFSNAALWQDFKYTTPDKGYLEKSPRICHIWNAEWVKSPGVAANLTPWLQWCESLLQIDGKFWTLNWSETTYAICFC